MTGEVSDDLFFGGGLRLLQPKRGHRVGTDAALLVAAARSRLVEGGLAVDLGAGVGAVGLALARAGAASVALVEVDPALAALAEENARRNGLADRVAVVAADVACLGRKGGPAAPAPASAALVSANPPFDDDRSFRASPNPAKALAHQAGAGLLEAWTAAAARLLAPGGSFVVILRAANLDRLLTAAAGRFGDIRIQPIHPREGALAGRLIVAARKGRRGRLGFLPSLTLHGAGGGFTAEVEALQRGEAVLAMDETQKTRSAREGRS